MILVLLYIYISIARSTTSAKVSLMRIAASVTSVPDSGLLSTPAAMFDGTAPVYNLTGQRLSAPQKGIMIQNGRKLVVK